MVLAAPTSACRMAREASTSTITPKLHVDQIIVGISEEGWSAHRAGPLGGWIGRRHKLRRDVARRTEGSVVEGRQILPHGPARDLGITRLLPLRPGDRALLVGVGRNQACIDRKPFATDQPSRNTCLNNTLKRTARQRRNHSSQRSSTTFATKSAISGH